MFGEVIFMYLGVQSTYIKRKVLNMYIRKLDFNKWFHLFGVLKIQGCCNNPVACHSKEGYKRYHNSCSDLQLVMNPFDFQNFPQKQCEKISERHCHCQNVPVVYHFHVCCFRDSLKTALKQCVETKLRCQNQHDCCGKMQLVIQEQ